MLDSEKLEELRARKKHAEDELVAQNERVEQLERDLLWRFLSDVYQELKSKTMQSCGVDEPLEFGLFPKYRQVRLSRVKDWLQAAAELSGLEITYYGDTSAGKQRYTVTLSERAKCCHGIFRGEESVLDFTKLVKVNNDRKEVWAECRAELAEKIILELQTCLERMPDLHLGVREFTPILKDGKTLFQDYFRLYNLMIPYSSLSRRQLKELTTEINAKIAYGDVELSTHDFFLKSALNVKIRRLPRKAKVAEPLFDFRKFYRKYDRVTAKLRKVFDQIVSGISLPSAEEQLLKLSPDYKLYYWFRPDDGLDFATLRDHFTHSLHSCHLGEAVREAFPEVLVSYTEFKNVERQWESVRDCAHGVESTEERIEFSYFIIPGAEVKSELLLKQLEVERIIADIKENRVMELAESFANMLLDKALKLSENVLLGHEWQFISDESYRVQLSYGDKVYEVDLNQLEDTGFVALLEKTVYEITDGALTVALVKRNYRLFAP